MNLKVWLRTNGIDDKLNRELALAAGPWFAHQLLNPFQVELLGTVTVKFCFKSTIGSAGLIKRLPALTPGLRRSFVIYIDRTMSYYWKARVLAHEFVHLKQYVCGDLRSAFVGDDLRTLWKDQDITDLPYRERPHEIEAEQLEGGLTKRFLIEICGWIDNEKAA